MNLSLNYKANKVKQLKSLIQDFQTKIQPKSEDNFYYKIMKMINIQKS